MTQTHPLAKTFFKSDTMVGYSDSKLSVIPEVPWDGEEEK